MSDFNKNKKGSMILATIAIIIACVLVIAIGWQALLLSVRSSPDIMVYELTNDINIAYAAPEEVVLMKPFPTAFFSGCPIGTVMFGTDNTGPGAKFGEGRVGVARCNSGCIVFMRSMYTFLSAMLGVDIALFVLPPAQKAFTAAKLAAIKHKTALLSRHALSYMKSIAARKFHDSITKYYTKKITKITANIIAQTMKQPLTQETAKVSVKQFFSSSGSFLLKRIKPQAIRQSLGVMREQWAMDALFGKASKSFTIYYLKQKLLTRWSKIAIRGLVYGIPMAKIGDATKYFECCGPGVTGREGIRATVFSMMPVAGELADMIFLLQEMNKCYRDIKFYYYIPSKTMNTEFKGFAASSTLAEYKNFADAPQILFYEKDFSYTNNIDRLVITG